MKYAHYENTTQKLLGWYDKNIHKNIPLPNIKISDNGWEAAMRKKANYVDVENKNVVYKDLRTDAEKKLNIENARYSRLETVFNAKTIGLTALAIDKPWMTNPQAIKNQFDIYEMMYANAKNGAYDAEKNQAIITANETAKVQFAELSDLLNSVRHVIEQFITADDVSADEMLDAADVITLTKEELTPEKISEIKTIFGL